MFLFIIIGICCLLLPLNLFHHFIDFFETLHSFCLAHVHAGEGYPVTSALLCGAKIRDEEFRDFFSKTGLYHLVIVSKAHLVLLTSLLSWFFVQIKLPLGKFFCFLILFGYALLCGPQPPMVRTIFSMLLLILSWRYRLGWNALTILVMSTFFTIAFNAKWIESLSLLHSSGCALAMLIGFQVGSTFWRRSLIAYIITLPFLWGWANVHPLTLLFQMLLSTGLLFLWLPASILSFIYPDSHLLADKLILFTMRMVKPFVDPIQLERSKTYHISAFLLWTFFWGLVLTFHLFRRMRHESRGVLFYSLPVDYFKRHTHKA